MERMACRSGTWVILKRAILSVAMEQLMELRLLVVALPYQRAGACRPWSLRNVPSEVAALRNLSLITIPDLVTHIEKGRFVNALLWKPLSCLMG